MPRVVSLSPQSFLNLNTTHTNYRFPLYNHLVTNTIESHTPLLLLFSLTTVEMVVSSLLTRSAAIGRGCITNSAISFQQCQILKVTNSTINSTCKLIITIQVKKLCKSLGKAVTKKRSGNQVKIRWNEGQYQSISKEQLIGAANQ